MPSTELSGSHQNTCFSQWLHRSPHSAIGLLSTKGAQMPWPGKSPGPSVHSAFSFMGQKLCRVLAISLLIPFGVDGRMAFQRCGIPQNPRRLRMWYLTLKRHFAGITYYIIYNYIQDLEMGKPSQILGMCSVYSNIYCVQYIVIK